MPATRHEFAPNCVWTMTVDGHADVDAELIALIREMRQRTPASRACEGRQMWQGSEPMTDEPIVRRLMTTSIYPAALDVARFYGWDAEHLEPQCTVCRPNIHPRGGYHTRHIHPSSEHLSGVYYAQAAEDCGDIVFHDLSRFLGFWNQNPPVVNPADANRRTFSVAPAAGLCVLFPAGLMHEVEPNQSDVERIGLAFNIRLL